jgi:membrane protease YdiL (CAAX protease family)
VFESAGAEITSGLEKFFTMDFATNYVIFSSGICVLIGVALFIMAANENIVRKKGLSIFLMILMILFTLSDLATNVSIIGIVAVLCSKSEKKKKSKKESISKLDKIKVTKKDLFLSILLVAVYFSQFIIDIFSEKIRIYAVIGYYLITLGLCLYVFWERYKRDFICFKNDFGKYIKYVFKMWGIMLLASFAAAIIVMALNGNSQSANQEALNGLPLWFMIPAACIWAPIVEEAIFRGVIRRFISNDILFVIVSSLSFGLLHTVGQEATLYLTIVQSLQYMAMGAVMAIAYVKSNNIMTNMGVHCVQNTFSTILLSFIK